MRNHPLHRRITALETRVAEAADRALGPSFVFRLADRTTVKLPVDAVLGLFLSEEFGEGPHGAVMRQIVSTPERASLAQHVVQLAEAARTAA